MLWWVALEAAAVMVPARGLVDVRVLARTNRTSAGPSKDARNAGRGRTARDGAVTWVDIWLDICRYDGQSRQLEPSYAAA